MNSELMQGLAAIAVGILSYFVRKYLGEPKNKREQQMLELALEELEECRQKLRHLQS